MVDQLSNSSPPGSLAGVDLPRFEVRDLPPDFDLSTILEPDAQPTRGDRGPAPCRHAVVLDEARIDADAARVVRRLTRAGHEAYLVGGCVRDLLLGARPKDFDVATSACPEEIRRLFRNSRIIGRRFRLVHVLFGAGKVIETATFRRAPQKEDDDGGELLIRSDNEFGLAHEDARRRDFTVNGLFYDLESCQVLDWVDGMPDIERRTINTIGDPVIRFQEDPVRILRAIKFAARLDCGIDPHVYDAIVACRSTLAMAARPRLFEEVLRLLRGGAAQRSFYLAWETGVLDTLLPELSTYLSDESDSEGRVWRMLTVVDRMTRAKNEPLSDIVLCGALLLEPLVEACGTSRDRMRASTLFLEPVIDRLNMPRRIADALRRIVALLPRWDQGRAARLRRSQIYLEMRTLLEIRDAADQVEAPAAEPPAQDGARRRRSRSRRRETPPVETTAGHG